MKDSRKLPALHDAAVRLLEQLRHTPKEVQVPLYRELAGLFVEARAHFKKSDGRPALDGRSPAYRKYLGEIFDAAGYSKAAKTQTLTALRYHIGQVLRAEYDAETIQSYGMDVEDPREKSKNRRSSRTAGMNALAARDIHGGALLAVTGVHLAVRNVLGNVADADLAAMDDESRAVADESLADAGEIIAEFRERLAGVEGAA